MGAGLYRELGLGGMLAGLVISSGATGGGGVPARHWGRGPGGGGAVTQQGCFLSAQRSDGLYHQALNAPVMLVLYVRSTTVLAVGNTQMYYSTCAGCSVSVASVMVSGRGGSV